jgi:polyisoprenoid-binding protein YceI
MTVLTRSEYLPLSVVLAMVSTTALATTVTYTIDPNHTHPSFEADHFNGLSIWRGVFKNTSGTVTVDAAAGTGTVDIDIDMASIDFGHDKLNDMAVNSAAPPILEAMSYPLAHYHGTLKHFRKGAPTAVVGTLTLHGVTRPVALRIDSFKCISHHPLLNREVCGADASGRLNRADFGIIVGRQYGFKMDVILHIQVEAMKADIG